MSVRQLRQDTQHYAPRLQVHAACCWHTSLKRVIASDKYRYGFEFDDSVLASHVDEGGESG
jgi:hypothetical protein